MVSFERLSDGKKIHPWQVVLYNTEINIVVYQQKNNNTRTRKDKDNIKL